MPEEERSEGESKRPVVWTPEDASNFLTNAIKESQKPLAEALAKPTIPMSAYLLTIGLMALLCGGGLYFLGKERGWYRQQLDTLQQRATRLEDRVVAAESQAARYSETSGEVGRLREREEQLQMELGEYRTRLEQLKDEAARSRRASVGQQEAAARARNQIRLMQQQFEGLDEEKKALAKQLMIAREMIRSLQEDALDRDRVDVDVLDAQPADADGEEPQEEVEAAVTPWWVRDTDEYEVIDPAIHDAGRGAEGEAGAAEEGDGEVEGEAAETPVAVEELKDADDEGQAGAGADEEPDTELDGDAADEVEEPGEETEATEADEVDPAPTTMDI